MFHSKNKEARKNFHHGIKVCFLAFVITLVSKDSKPVTLVFPINSQVTWFPRVSNMQLHTTLAGFSHCILFGHINLCSQVVWWYSTSDCIHKGGIYTFTQLSGGEGGSMSYQPKVLATLTW